jgi:hypothetical protein
MQRIVRIRNTEYGIRKTEARPAPAALAPLETETESTANRVRTVAVSGKLTLAMGHNIF